MLYHFFPNFSTYSRGDYPSGGATVPRSSRSFRVCPPRELQRLLPLHERHPDPRVLRERITFRRAWRRARSLQLSLGRPLRGSQG